MRAYSTRCAVCSFRHGNLLDAAHITADASADGDPVMSNGLALCKMHHGAYDNVTSWGSGRTWSSRSDLMCSRRPTARCCATASRCITGSR